MHPQEDLRGAESGILANKLEIMHSPMAVSNGVEQGHWMSPVNLNVASQRITEIGSFIKLTCGSFQANNAESEFVLYFMTFVLT